MAAVAVSIPVVCPADECLAVIDCAISVEMSEVGMLQLESRETWLAEVMLHVLQEHSELAGDAPSER